ncbi:Metallo-dependent phosphatase-like protein [Stachybotrys elegans]|uniref:Metallo-dependent phosphatase-like protein n=1 Tax=Stachybotrys elegans TaxID=80388 RepID=A0A8K0WK16_9HYPO|nr:Metallo-dependent phosphatase-like protein [Stachybotrys elegans]
MALYTSASAVNERLKSIKTRFLIISDTHGLDLSYHKPLVPADVVLHCGDLTEHSKFSEIQATIQLLRSISAPLKLVIAGNHDWTLDKLAYELKVAEAKKIDPTCSDHDIEKAFGKYGAVRRLLEAAREHGILFLEEGVHNIRLHNGSNLKLYASPYTPSNGGEWGFQYNSSHDFDIPDVDVVMTHGPPLGIMDRSGRDRIGCSQLFTAVRKAQPRLHCFGHVHKGWGGKLVAWRKQVSESPCHFNDIDNNNSEVIGSLLHPPELAEFKDPIQPETTLFVNAALEADGALSQRPWLVEMDLSAHTEKEVSIQGSRYGRSAKPHASVLEMSAESIGPLHTAKRV